MCPFVCVMGGVSSVGESGTAAGPRQLFVNDTPISLSVCLSERAEQSVCACSSLLPTTGLGESPVNKEIEST